VIEVSHYLDRKFTFKDYFDVCLDSTGGSLIPIAIFRSKNSFTDNYLPYLITNPDKSSILLVRLILISNLI
jgi:hypothetical protein